MQNLTNSLNLNTGKLFVCKFLTFFKHFENPGKIQVANLRVAKMYSGENVCGEIR